MTIRMSSAALRAENQPEQIVLYRGYEDQLRATARGAYCARRPSSAEARCTLRLGLEASYDTGMYDEQAVSADALDGPTLELGVLAEWRLAEHVRLVGGASYADLITRHVTRSAFDSSYAVACADSGHDAVACAAANAGRGMPSTNGTYSMTAYTLGLSVLLDWWSR
jgi:hypothetical protein